MAWDPNFARACKPPAVLVDSIAPVLGTGAHALASPLPYGLGVRALCLNGDRRPLKLYYVSPKAAAARASRGVKAGWYVVAEPGVEFELAITAVQPEFPNVGGVKMENGHSAKCAIFVDGIFVESYRMYWKFGELTCAGFIESESYVAGAARGTATTRRFKFKKAETTEEAGDAADNNNAGSIFVEMFSGKLEENQQNQLDLSHDLNGVDGKICEKEAAKNGKSIKVGKDGERVTNTIHRGTEGIPVSKSEGSFEIYLREKFWMESRQIIDIDGKPWKPTVEVSDVNVDEQPDVVTPVEAVEPAKKKAKNEDVVDLTEEPEPGTPDPPAAPPVPPVQTDPPVDIDPPVEIDPLVEPEPPVVVVLSD